MAILYEATNLNRAAVIQNRSVLRQYHQNRMVYNNNWYTRRKQTSGWYDNRIGQPPYLLNGTDDNLVSHFIFMSGAYWQPVYGATSDDARWVTVSIYDGPNCPSSQNVTIHGQDSNPNADAWAPNGPLNCTLVFWDNSSGSMQAVQYFGNGGNLFQWFQSADGAWHCGFREPDSMRGKNNLWVTVSFFGCKNAHAKIEAGNRYTVWTPASEDLFY